MHTRTDGTEAEGAHGEGPLERLLRAHASSLHLRRTDGAGTAGRPGSVYRVDPAWGRGLCWCCPLDDEMAVFSCELSDCADAAAACPTPDYFSVTAQRKAHAVPSPARPPSDPTAACGAAGRPSARTSASDATPSRPVSTDRRPKAAEAMVEESPSPLIAGGVWKGQSFLALPGAGEYLRITGIVLLPRALQRMSLRCQCDPLMLSGAIAALDGTRQTEGLARVMDDIACARPSPVVAHAYYESKVTEAMSLIVDRHLSAKGARSVPLRPADRTALNRARRHLADNLDRTVPAGELCAVACMGASKLTALFKSAEGATPQEYARSLRMERACRLLARTDLPLSAIASQLGFKRQGSFSEAFKERFGMTPREFRNLARGR